MESREENALTKWTAFAVAVDYLRDLLMAATEADLRAISQTTGRTEGDSGLAPLPRISSDLKIRAVEGAVLETELAIGEVSARSGLAVSAIRFYEDKGLIASTRTRRRASAASAATCSAGLAFIQAAQRVGLTLDDIGVALAALPGDVRPDRVGVEGASPSSWRPLLDERIALLERPAGPARPLHRLRLPVARPLPAEQPRRPGGRARAGGPLPAGRSPAWARGPVRGRRRSASARPAGGSPGGGDPGPGPEGGPCPTRGRRRCPARPGGLRPARRGCVRRS